jgi:hypothetical protein
MTSMNDWAGYYSDSAPEFCFEGAGFELLCGLVVRVPGYRFSDK